MIKKIVIFMLLFFLPQIAEAQVTIVELNEKLSVQETLDAYNRHVDFPLQIHGTFYKSKAPNTYIDSYTAVGENNFRMIVYRNKIGYICNVGAMVPDIYPRSTVKEVGKALLLAAMGANCDIPSSQNDQLKRLDRLVENSINGTFDHVVYKPLNRSYTIFISRDEIVDMWMITCYAYIDE